MKKLFDGVQKVCHALLFLFVVILVSVTFWQVFCRFVLKIPCSWAEEVVRLAFVWLIFVGSALAVRERTHLSLDMLTNRFKGTAKHISNIFVLAAILAIAVVMLIGGGDYVSRSASKTMVTLPLPANCTYVSIPISAFFMIVFGLEQLVLEIRRWKEEGKA